MSFGEIVCVYSEQSNLLERIKKWRVHRAELVGGGNGPVRLAGPVTRASCINASR
jgi:hypothetical protein